MKCNFWSYRTYKETICFVLFIRYYRKWYNSGGGTQSKVFFNHFFVPIPLWYNGITQHPKPNKLFSEVCRRRWTLPSPLSAVGMSWCIWFAAKPQIYQLRWLNMRRNCLKIGIFLGNLLYFAWYNTNSIVQYFKQLIVALPPDQFVNLAHGTLINFHPPARGLL